MFNWKLSTILGGVGMALSLIVGLISGAGFSHALLRSMIFFVVFFALGTGLLLLINNFIPELLYPDNTGKDESDEAAGGPGSRINISLEDKKILPEMFRNLDNNEEVGDIGELINGTFRPPESSLRSFGSDTDDQGVDLKHEDGYTGIRSQSGQFSADSPEVLPDLDQMTGSFMEKDSVMDGETGEQFEPVRRPVGNKAQPLKGDFNPKELAAGIRTILSEGE